MALCATITVTAGPDRGKVFELAGEMVRLGTAPDNEVIFSDNQVGDHHASIVRREGRFAIFSAVAEGIEVDGTQVPAERWVWLPEAATIRVGARTSIEFSVSDAGSDEKPANGETPPRQAAPVAAAPRTSGSASGTAVLSATRSTTQKGRRSTETAPGSDAPARPRRSADRSEKKSRTLARFITDGPGDPLVKLGEDGHLPELMLHEAQSGQRDEAGPKQSNPVLLLTAIGLSFGMTILMLLMDVGNFTDRAAEKDRARTEIMEYYGAEGDTLKPYQLHLREARLARTRKDFENERQEYRAVLTILRSEARDKLYRYTGLTGRLDYDESSENKKSDKRLEELIGVLLSE